MALGEGVGAAAGAVRAGIEGIAGREATVVPTTAEVSLGSSKVSAGASCAPAESMAFPAATLCSTTPSARLAPTRYGQAGLPSMPIKATLERAPPLRLTTTPVNTNLEAFRLLAGADAAPDAPELAAAGCPPPNPLAKASASTGAAAPLGRAAVALAGAAGPCTNFKPQYTALAAASSQSTNVNERVQKERCIRLL